MVNKAVALAVQTADAEMNKAGLPAYSDLVLTLQSILLVEVRDDMQEHGRRVRMADLARVKVAAVHGRLYSEDRA